MEMGRAPLAVVPAVADTISPDLAAADVDGTSNPAHQTSHHSSSGTGPSRSTRRAHAWK